LTQRIARGLSENVEKEKGGVIEASFSKSKEGVVAIKGKLFLNSGGY